MDTKLVTVVGWIASEGSHSSQIPVRMELMTLCSDPSTDVSSWWHMKAFPGSLVAIVFGNFEVNNMILGILA